MERILTVFGLFAVMTVLATCAPASTTTMADDAFAMAEDALTKSRELERRVNDLEAQIEDLEGRIPY